jgi:hypothetical protein
MIYRPPCSLFQLTETPFRRHGAEYGTNSLHHISGTDNRRHIRHILGRSLDQPWLEPPSSTFSPLRNNARIASGKST